ncbi:MAG TPA: DUF1579 family protein [Kofleriaceae bacterium]|nr:DUF1579 family protein [Kofleriaceae bacterium]
MKRLTELFAGTWRGDETLYPSAWDPKGGPASGVWTVRSVCDGWALAVDYDESRDGKVAYRGHGVHAWDARDRAFYTYWFDSIGMAPKSAVRATLDGERYTYVDISPMGQSRFTYAFTGGELAFSIELSRDGRSWSPMHEGRYRRD